MKSRPSAANNMALVLSSRYTRSDALMSGVSLAVIGELLGHKQTRTTQRYAHLANHVVRQGLEIATERIVEAVTPVAALPPAPSGGCGDRREHARPLRRHTPAVSTASHAMAFSSATASAPANARRASGLDAEPRIGPGDARREPGEPLAAQGLDGGAVFPEDGGVHRPAPGHYLGVSLSMHHELRLRVRGVRPLTEDLAGAVRCTRRDEEWRPSRRVHRSARCDHRCSA
jgi:hypothetical protein